MLVQAQSVNRTQTNGWGSTPSQRHYINSTQALQVVEAGMARANAIGYVAAPDQKVMVPCPNPKH
jgi:hypothetical protein